MGARTGVTRSPAGGSSRARLAFRISAFLLAVAACVLAISYGGRAIEYRARQQVIRELKPIAEPNRLRVDFEEWGLSFHHLIVIHYRLTGVPELRKAFWYAIPGEVKVEK